MREIKFRGWDEVTKIMHYPSSNMMWDVAHILKFFEPVMQFTGLQDKNGKDIYEGDICLSFGGIKNVVDFHNGAFGYWVEKLESYKYFISFASNYHFEFNEGKSDYIEILGNIFENPEILTP